jgi:predicted dienelactone hydrolase
MQVFLLLLSIQLAVASSQLTSSDFSQQGPYNAGWTQVTVNRPNSSTFSAYLFYPATTRGRGATFDASGGNYPAITFGHGYLQSVSRYQSTLEHLATWGFFVIASESESGFFPNHSNFANDLIYCVDYLESQNQNPNSPYYRSLAVGNYGASGHSMGGGCSLLATSRDQRIRAVSNLAAAETNPSAIQAMRNISVAVQLISGSSDTITPVNQHGQLMFNAGFAPKQIPVITGGWHCGFMDSSSFGCDSGPLNRTVQLQITRKLLTTFFSLYLKGNQDTWSFVWGPELFDNLQINTEHDSGLLILPSQTTINVTPGKKVNYTLNVTNTGNRPTSIDLFIEGIPWTTQTLISNEQLAPLGQTTTRLSTSIPSDTQPGDYQAIISVKRNEDNATRSYKAIVFRVTK